MGRKLTERVKKGPGRKTKKQEAPLAALKNARLDKASIKFVPRLISQKYLLEECIFILVLDALGWQGAGR